MNNENLVPIFIDKSEGDEFEQIVRFYYFVVTFTESSQQILNIELSKYPDSGVDVLKPLSLPVMWLESNHRFILTGVLGGGYFTSVEKVDELFDFFEENDLVVDVIFHSFHNLMRESYLDIKRGEVYRLNTSVLAGFEISGKETLFINSNNMVISPEETDTIKKWNKQVVDGVKARYREQPERTLRHRVKRGDK
ncbi:MAG: hypothetical protein ACI8ZB_003823 [Desulforhopalus sp.]|jgi:hypothetical protein